MDTGLRNQKNTLIRIHFDKVAAGRRPMVPPPHQTSQEEIQEHETVPTETSQREPVMASVSTETGNKVDRDIKIFAAPTATSTPSSSNEIRMIADGNSGVA